MLGCRDHEIFPMVMAEKYQADDLNVIEIKNKNKGRAVRMVNTSMND